jgi:hypothetical protein|tara:strand:+ start:240 stop:668 length:429 start_codon:yes stop_codon:yes gene_type:complete
MATVREQILSRIKTALTGTLNVGTRIYRSRLEAFARNELPAIQIMPITDTGDQALGGAKLEWDLTVRIQVIVRGATPDVVADDIVADMHNKLTADPQLGGYALDIQPQTVNFLLESAEGGAGAIQCDYLVTYRTDAKNLALQ